MESPDEATTPSADASAAAPASSEPPAVGAVDQAALDWARQAYARLKAQQEAQAVTAPPTPLSAPPDLSPARLSEPEAPQVTVAAPRPPEPEQERSAIAPALVAGPEPEPQPPVPDAEVVSSGSEPQLPGPEPEPPAASAESEPLPPTVGAPPSGLSLLEQAAAARQQRLQEITAAPSPEAATAPASVQPPPAEAPLSGEEADRGPTLGAFDDVFTWSAEVLAAQGRRVEDISLEEIDWLGRLRQGLEKTRRNFVSQLLENLGDDPLTPEVLDDLETTLLRADVGVKATDQVLEALRRRLNEEVVDPAEGLRFLKQQLRDLLEGPISASASPLLVPQRDRLNIWLMVGVNGVGKTTTLGKLANLAVRSGYSCLIAAADTFRAAAVRQVQVWGERSDVPVISNPTANADPAAVVFDAVGAARSRGTELVLVDTAGRLQTKHNLMEELSKVRRIIDRLAPEAVVESLLVLDASQGQNGLRQAMAFASAAGLTGVVITKLDGSARGGVALAVASEAGLPIRFIGAGEGIRDLRPFNSFEFVEALLAG
ncbi:MAG: signal recognition particle-docking protein FtsY [Cyanobium sp.]